MNLVPARSQSKTRSSHSRAHLITVRMGTTDLAVPTTTVAPASTARNRIMMATVTISSGSSTEQVLVGMVSGADMGAVATIKLKF